MPPDAPTLAGSAGNSHWQWISYQLLHGVWESCVGPPLVSILWAHVLGWDSQTWHWWAPSLCWWCLQCGLQWRPLLYKPYRCFMSTDQTCFLHLLDNIRVPHKDKKQLYGESLEIIGLVVDVHNMTISMSSQAKQNLIEAMHDFVLNAPDNKCQQPLWAWLRILRQTNWALNAFPILKLALNSSYDKILGKTALSQGVYLNKWVTEDLFWFADSISHLDGIQLIEAKEWSANQADLEAWCDGSKDGLGFWAPKLSCAFFSDLVLPDNLSFNVFLNKAIAILTAIHWASTLHPIPSHLTIHTNSSNSFNIFNSLWASNPYNFMLMSATSIWIEHRINLHIFFIEGKCNVITDALSCCAFDLVHKLALDASIQCFTPLSSPFMLVTGAYQKWISVFPLWCISSVNRKKWPKTQIWYAMRPGLEGSSSLIPWVV